MLGRLTLDVNGLAVVKSYTKVRRVLRTVRLPNVVVTKLVKQIHDLLLMERVILRVGLERKQENFLPELLHCFLPLNVSDLIARCTVESLRALPFP